LGFSFLETFLQNLSTGSFPGFSKSYRHPALFKINVPSRYEGSHCLKKSRASFQLRIYTESQAFQSSNVGFAKKIFYKTSILSTISIGIALPLKT
jgi:hypothetical protein